MALSIVIILFFLGALFLLEWPLLKRSWEIGQLLSSCRRLKAEDKRELQLGMNSIMDGMAWLREPMSRFEKTWRGAFSDELGHAIGECEFADFIGSKDLFPKGLFQLAQNRQLARSIPGILVAAGILGTFLGLVQSLPSLAKIEGQESLKGIISPVVEGLGLAFYTSLAGIFCSILFLLIDRIAVQILEQRVTELSYFVGTAYPTISPAEARTFLLDQVQDGVETLRTMGADLASELAKELKPALSEAMAEQLTPVMERMQDTVEELAARTTERQVEGIQQLVDGFMDSMNSSMGHQFQTLTEVLDSTVEFQVKIRDGLNQLQRKTGVGRYSSDGTPGGNQKSRRSPLWILGPFGADLKHAKRRCPEKFSKLRVSCRMSSKAQRNYSDDLTSKPRRLLHRRRLRWRPLLRGERSFLHPGS